MKILKRFRLTIQFREKLVQMLWAFLVCGLFIALILPAGDINDLKIYRLKGSVRSLMEIKYSLASKDSNALKTKVLFQKYTTFDKFGYETSYDLYQDGALYLSSTYLLQASGKQSEMNEYKPDGTLNLNVTYKYDDKGYRTEACYNWAENRQIGDIGEETDYYHEIVQNEIFTRVLFKNEYRGYCTEEKYLKADSSLSFMITARYDPRGNKTESAYYHSNERLSWKTKYKYNRYDNLVESEVYKSNRIAVLSTYKYQFDDIGNWITRREDRHVEFNILTAGLDTANTVTERTIEYY